eukprot:CAMPEP_0170566782 /NCGR_PEP_ID=MMETSP0211-20121228/80056_1 /TAXON_ID=311385 /ORGANISM="Pseudokeronopsis sp., Strain OXSARD2" /LENGTH=57 /DNA_ID=CAMNT_0010888047 /DNA_START=1305 /DNA_END=1478 /DNA_ORIENTATION=+
MAFHSFKTTLFEDRSEEKKVEKPRAPKETSFQLKEYLAQRRLNQEELSETIKHKTNN